MNDYLGVFVSVYFLIVAISALLMGIFQSLWAKLVGRIEKAGYWRGVVVCFLAPSAYILLIALVMVVAVGNPLDFSKLVGAIGVVGLVVLNLVLFLVSYFLSGLVVYRAPLVRVMLGTLLMPLLYAGLMTYGLIASKVIA